MVTTCCCDLMNFCIFDVITYSSIDSLIATPHVVIWWIFVSLMWLHTAHILCRHGAVRCDLMNFCIFDVITYSSYIKWVQRQTLWFDEFLYLWCDYIQLQVIFIGLLMVVIWWIFVSLMWLHTAAQISLWVVPPLWFDEFLYLWCDYIQQIRDLKVNPTVVIWWIFVSLMWLHTADETERFSIERCDLMNFCIFDVITYSLTWGEVHEQGVVIWWIFVSLMWLHTAEYLTEMCRCGCDLMNFCIFDVITYSWWNVCIQYGLLWFDEFLYLWCDYIQHKYTPSTVHGVVIWWIFVSLMWLHTARGTTGNIERSLWFDEFLYLWCDYIQPLRRVRKTGLRCDLMNFCIFDVITYSVEQNGTNNNAVVIWWIFVSLMWLHTAVRPGVVSWDLLWFDEFLYLWCDYIQHNACI